MGIFWGDCKCGSANGHRCCKVDWHDCESCKHSTDAQEELQAICSASEVDWELAGSAEDL